MANKKSDSQLFAFLGVLLTLVGFIIVYATRKDDKYAMHYAKQGLALFFGWLVAWVIEMVISLMFNPLATVINLVMWLVIVIAWIFGMIYSLSGQMKDIPVFGDIAKKIKV